MFIAIMPFYVVHTPFLFEAHIASRLQVALLSKDLVETGSHTSQTYCIHGRLTIEYGFLSFSNILGESIEDIQILVVSVPYSGFVFIFFFDFSISLYCYLIQVVLATAWNRHRNHQSSPKPWSSSRPVKLNQDQMVCRVLRTLQKAAFSEWRRQGHSEDLQRI